MELIRSQAWYQTSTGAARGYIQPHQLKELWFHTGTACNLSCDFCLEGSGPGDKRLELVRFDDVKPFIDEAIELGVEQFSFTGGEPFLAKQLVDILEYAAGFRPCLVLTNGTDALQKRMHDVERLLQCEHPVSFRVSIDSCDPEMHDAGRGTGSFDSALTGLRMLHERGFSVSVARHMADGENGEQVEAGYRRLFAERGLPESTAMVAFPDFLPPGSTPEQTEVSEHCMTTYQTEENRRSYMCAFSKMVVKRQGQMRIYACTLVDDDIEYELGQTLTEALQYRVSMKHHRCFSCFKFGASCSEL